MNQSDTNTTSKKTSKQTDFKTASQQVLAALSLAGQVAINQPNIKKPPQVYALESKQDTTGVDEISFEEHQEIINKMVAVVNGPVGNLEKEQELYLEQQLSDMLGFEVSAQLDGNRLNHSIGIMGGEQHLRRFPTDTLSQHDAYQEAGMAPNRGAFGWFTQNGELTAQAVAQEKYYFAVQTLYLPDWNQRYSELKPWYKFRKMIAINPSEEIAVVGVVGDAGPAMWVKKQFGGSPEVMKEGKIWSPKSKGRVILLFVDDPDNNVPLGPIDVSWHQPVVA